MTDTKCFFSIPDSLVVRILNRALLTAMHEYPELFYDDFIIDTAYGCPGQCPWTGNRYNDYQDFDDNWVNEVVGLYAASGIKYRLVFTNFLLRKADLKNEIGNKVALQLSKRSGSSVMVSTPMMYQYMARYSSLTRCWSTTTDYGKTPEERIKKINQLSEKNLVVIPYEFNNKPELKLFTHPNNLEVLLNEDCIDNCPRRREHWTNVCKGALTNNRDICPCLMGANERVTVTHRIDKDKLKEYLQLGINHFKISGRHSERQALAAYIEFFVKRSMANEFFHYFESYEENFLKKYNMKLDKNNETAQHSFVF